MLLNTVIGKAINSISIAQENIIRKKEANINDLYAEVTKNADYEAKPRLFYVLNFVSNFNKCVLANLKKQKFSSKEFVIFKLLLEAAYIIEINNYFTDSNFREECRSQVEELLNVVEVQTRDLPGRI